MAYTLKTTGLATKLIACIAVDEDGTTVKDFVSGNTGTYNAGVVAPKTGVATWKGTNRNWFKVDYADYYTPRGWTWSPVKNIAGNGVSFFCAANSIAALTDNPICGDGGNNGVLTDTTHRLIVRTSAGLRGTGTTVLPSGAKISFGVNIKNNTANLPFFYGAENAGLAADGTYTTGEVVPAWDLTTFGGMVGVGTTEGTFFLACYFSDPTLLTEAEFQSLHNDWFGTLFQASSASFTLSGGIVATLTPGGSLTVSATTRFVTETLVSRAGSAKANLSSLAWYWTDTFGGPVVASGTVETTDAAGVIVANIPGTTLLLGQFGYLALEASTGERRLYRLPVQ